MSRKAVVDRKTLETDIHVEIDLDGTGKAKIDTGIGFLDHMLNSFVKHGFFDLTVSCRGDLCVDCHHSTEDIGIVLGQAILKALGDKKGIHRYGECILPMDDALVVCALDLCGRPYLGFDLPLLTEKVGNFDTELIREFYYALSYSAMMNIHVRKLAGENTHHLIEASFKAFARALRQGVDIDPKVTGVLSAKGVI